MNGISMTRLTECEEGVELKFNVDNKEKSFLLDAARQFGDVSEKDDNIYILHVESEVKKIAINYLTSLLA